MATRTESEWKERNKDGLKLNYSYQSIIEPKAPKDVIVSVVMGWPLILLHTMIPTLPYLPTLAMGASNRHLFAFSKLPYFTIFASSDPYRRTLSHVERRSDTK